MDQIYTCTSLHPKGLLKFYPRFVKGSGELLEICEGKLYM